MSIGSTPHGAFRRAATAAAILIGAVMTANTALANGCTVSVNAKNYRQQTDYKYDGNRRLPVDVEIDLEARNCDLNSLRIILFREYSGVYDRDVWEIFKLIDFRADPGSGEWHNNNRQFHVNMESISWKPSNRNTKKDACERLPGVDQVAIVNTCEATLRIPVLFTILPNNVDFRFDQLYEAHFSARVVHSGTNVFGTVATSGTRHIHVRTVTEGESGGVVKGAIGTKLDIGNLARANPRSEQSSVDVFGSTTVSCNMRSRYGGLQLVDAPSTQVTVPYWIRFDGKKYNISKKARLRCRGQLKLGNQARRLIPIRAGAEQQTSGVAGKYRDVVTITFGFQ